MRVREGLLLARNGIGLGVGSSLLKGTGYKWGCGRVNKAICCCCLRLATSKVDVENCGRRLMFGLKKLNLCMLHWEILERPTRNDPFFISPENAVQHREIPSKHVGVKDPSPGMWIGGRKCSFSTASKRINRRGCSVASRWFGWWFWSFAGDSWDIHPLWSLQLVSRKPWNIPIHISWNHNLSWSNLLKKPVILYVSSTYQYGP